VATSTVQQGLTDQEQGVTFLTISRKFNNTYLPQLLDSSKEILSFGFVERKMLLMDN